MNCLECQELLQKRLDGESVSGSEALDRHLSECTACRELHAGAVCLLEGLKQQPSIKPASGFAQALAAAVIRDRRRRRERTRRGVFLTVALAASVLLMLLMAYQWMPRSGPNQKQPDPGHRQEGSAKGSALWPSTPRSNCRAPADGVDGALGRHDARSRAGGVGGHEP